MDVYSFFCTFKCNKILEQPKITMLKFFIGIILIVTISWVIFWREQVSIRENLIVEQLNKYEESNFRVNYSLRTKGFPNRIDTEIENLKIIVNKNESELTIKRALVMSLIYNSDKFILSFEPPMELKVGDIILEILNGKLQISVSRKNPRGKATFTLHGTNFRMNLNGQKFLTIKDIIFATRSIGKVPSAQDELFIKIDGLYLIDPDEKLEEEKQNTTFVFDFSNDLLETFNPKQILFLETIIGESKSLNKGSLEIVNTNLDPQKYLDGLPQIIKDLP